MSSTTVTTTTKVGVRAESAATQIVTPTSGVFVGATGISIQAKRYGADNNITINIDFKASAGKEECEATAAAEYTDTGALDTAGIYKLSLQSGKEYTEEDIETILAAAGLSMDVTFYSPNPDQPNTLFVTDGANTTAVVELKNGSGLGDEDAYLGEATYGVTAGGRGITLQVGANEGQTMSFSIEKMDATALGVNSSNVDVSTQTGASSSLGKIDEAIQKVSKQRSLLGAVQNRLEHTIANLDNTAENLQAAESGIRDVDIYPL